MITETKFTAQEQKFFSRCATKMADGMRMEQAMRDVLAEDQAAHQKIQSFRASEKAHFSHKMARQVFSMIHMRSALEYPA